MLHESAGKDKTISSENTPRDINYILALCNGRDIILLHKQYHTATFKAGYQLISFVSGKALRSNLACQGV